MPHVALVPLVGFRIHEQELLELGMSLPGLQKRGAAIAELPALGLLTLAGMTPPHWTCSYHGAPAATEELVQQILSERPDLVAISALTASIEEAYRLSRRLILANVPVVIGGLHVTACSDEARRNCTSVVVGNGEPVWRQVLADAERGELAPVYRAPRGRAKLDWPLPRSISLP